jgi:hypothetical protein
MLKFFLHPQDLFSSCSYRISKVCRRMARAPFQVLVYACYPTQDSEFAYLLLMRDGGRASLEVARVARLLLKPPRERLWKKLAYPKIHDFFS